MTNTLNLISEKKRLELVRSLQLLDTEAEESYDDIVKIAAEICGAEMAVVTLIDDTRVWFKAKIGLKVNEVNRDLSFCSRALASGTPLIIADALLDSRFCKSPLTLTSPHIRFYAGFPLFAGQGLCVGTLCVLSAKPKTLNSSQIRLLGLLAKQTSILLESRGRDLLIDTLKANIEDLSVKSAEASKMVALGEMASGIAHEINNPLAVMVAWAGQIIELAEQDELDVQSVQRMGSAIERVALRISKIVKAFRMLSRDGSSMAFENTKLRTIFEDVLEISQQRFKSQQIDLRIVLPPEDLVLSCRSVEISQILMNLLNNAFDAVQHRDKRWVTCKVFWSATELKILIQDSGGPLSEAVRKKMMTPFFTTKEAGQGTGLGLSISRRIAQAHGGDLHFDPAQENTTFILSLPLKPAQSSLALAR